MALLIDNRELIETLELYLRDRRGNGRSGGNLGNDIQQIQELAQRSSGIEHVVTEFIDPRDTEFIDPRETEAYRD